MCTYECKGDYYRGCQHYVRRYYTGNRTDCLEEDCKTSSAHKHKTARDCGCPQVKEDDQKIVNMFQCKCESCEDPRAHR
ncbi:hypothetical protein BD410DRAFT_813289 [Rickenella mellea]|uniref:Uncharacterized protein n=1 Tax=Rickenella mellea TaxID=50990 RepID=A0A4Y7QF71_9AGAM|nr:hypothetical protein BD410DRAFT_813289 [Rickenella mellea]